MHFVNLIIKIKEQAVFKEFSNAKKLKKKI